MSLADRVRHIKHALDRAGVCERPVVVVDLDAFDANAGDLVRRAQGRPIRVASKSLRVRVWWSGRSPSPACRGCSGTRFGALRSPARTPEQLADLAREVVRRPALHLVGLMAYEGQIAGVGDRARTPYGLAVRTMQRLSAAEIAPRRAAAVAAVREIADLEFVNGGGTGSLETTRTEEAVTEIAAGSGLIGSALFDGYRAFTPTPAVLMGFPVVRRPARNTATLLGGGWIASGPAGADRLPTIAVPQGLSYAPTEGPGEVQTPVIGPAADALRLGDLVWLRHAKSGEPAEHALRYHAVRGDEVVTALPTYRGEGQFFL
ncbi:amino acid deaminase/aldolase [Brachybacterium sp. EF45031]|uniref:hypothetical protein n=1 Tax=Brachybacterium sillae TaxID=2810536 RepID=UPI00217E0F3A|nr:hypothetical protein [Brachybacterium sillae]MCS6712625.1 amino acid deaminase/aldolase [Brachybacterium sillae]